MKKQTLLTLAFIINFVTFSQDFDASNSFGNSLTQITTNPFKNSSPVVIDGSEYLFDSWDNIGVIQTQDNKKYKVSNINYNIENDKFVYRTNKDSIQEFNTSKLKNIIVNNRKFNVYNRDNGNNHDFIEVLVQDDELLLYKIYKLKIREGVFSPISGQGNDKYFIYHKYYLKKDDTITPMKLKKSELLKVFGSKANQIKSFAKTNKLSYTKDKDVKKMFLHFNTL